MSSSRNYGIDLFRIVSMLMVVTLHVLGRGGILEAGQGVVGNYEVGWLIEAACYGAVNCFALISGYVGIYSKCRFSNLLTLWCQVIFISVLLQGFQYIIQPSSFELKNALSTFMPVFTRKYWYFTDYCILFLFMPLLNIALTQINKTTLKRSLIFISIFFTLSSFFPGYQFNSDPFILNQGYSVLWLMLLYLIGGYVAKYNPWETTKKRTWILIFLLCVGVAAASKIFSDLFPAAYVLFSENVLIAYHSPLILLSSIALLLLFSRITIRKKAVLSIIKFVSPLCFGIYIVQLHPFIWGWLKNRFANVASYPFPAFLGAVIGITLAVFLACMIVEVIRFYLFKWFKIKNRLSSLDSRLFRDDSK